MFVEEALQQIPFNSGKNIAIPLFTIPHPRATALLDLASHPFATTTLSPPIESSLKIIANAPLRAKKLWGNGPKESSTVEASARCT